MDAGEIGGVALVERIDLEDDAVLVALGIDGRDLPLREGIVERVVDVLHLHAQPRRRDAVDHHIGLQAALLAVGVDVDELGQLLQPVERRAASSAAPRRHWGPTE